MSDVKTATAVVVLGLYSVLLLLLLRPGSRGPDLVTQSGLALAGLAAV
jgi:hypothetical protein